MPQYETESPTLLLPILNELPQAVLFLHPTLNYDGAVADFKIVYANKLAREVLPLLEPDLGLLQERQPFAEHTKAIFDCSLAVMQTAKSNCYTVAQPHQQIELMLKPCEEGVLIMASRSANTSVPRNNSDMDEVLKAIIDHSPNGIILYQPIRDGEGVISDFYIAQHNSRSNELTGITAAERKGFTLKQVLDKLGAPELFNRYIDVVENNTTTQREQFLPETEKWVSVSSVRLGTGLLVMLTDITELKRSQQTLQNESQLSISILNTSINGLFVLEAVRNEDKSIEDFRFVRVNKKVADLLGKQEEEIIGKSYLGLLAPSKENGLFALKKQILETGTPVQKEFQYSGAGIDGWFLISMAPLGTDGIVETFTDITESKRANERFESVAHRFETVVNTSKAGMFTIHPVVDDQGEIIDFRFGIVNEAVAAYIGQTAKVLVGALASIYFPAYRTNGLFDIYKESYVTGKRFNFDFHYEDGYDVFFNIDVVKTGTEVLVTFTDHTALKRLQRELERNVDELKRLNTNLEDFTYAASHDLKEPVRKIRFFSERMTSLMSDRMTPEEKSIMNRVQNATGRMSLLIDDLLEYSQVSLGAKEFELVNLNDKLSLVLEDLEITISEKNAVVEVGVLPVVKGHRRQLQQLFQNLVSNALKYSKPDVAPHVSISARKVNGKDTAADIHLANADRLFYLIEVSDNGIGFDQEDASRIFNVFTRLHGKGEYAGTGVGLSIVKKVVENHDGFIWATSEAGKGATFNLLLPIHA